MAQATITALTGQSCAGTRFGRDLNCTSNDFTASLTFGQPAATALTSCRAGETISIDVVATVQSNAPGRYDGGFFLGEVANDPRLNNASNTCSIGVFPTTPSPFIDVDTDICGDYLSNGNSTLLIQGVQLICAPAPGTNQLGIPYTLVFNNQTGGATCTAANITANNKAKCVSSVSSTVTGVDVNGYVTITKQTVPSGDTQSFTFNGTSSGTVTPPNFLLTDGLSDTFEVDLDPTGGSRVLTITESAVGGWDPTASITCTSPSGGSASTYVVVDNANRTITATLDTVNFGALCTVTNTKQADLVTVKTLASGDPTPDDGDTVTFLVTVTNNGPAQATNVTLTDSLPAGLTATAGNGVVSQGSYVAGTGVWTIGTLNNGASATLTLEGTVDGGQGGITITNTTTAATTPDQPDPTTVGDDLIESVTVNVNPQLTIVKTADATINVPAGQVVTYTYDVTNTGNVTITGVTVSDVHNGSGPPPVPGGETLFNDAAPAGDSTDAATNASWDTLAPGDTVRFTATYTVTQQDVETRQ